MSERRPSAAGVKRAEAISELSRWAPLAKDYDLDRNYTEIFCELQRLLQLTVAEHPIRGS